MLVTCTNGSVGKRSVKLASMRSFAATTSECQPLTIKDAGKTFNIGVYDVAERSELLKQAFSSCWSFIAKCYAQQSCQILCLRAVLLECKSVPMARRMISKYEGALVRTA